MKKRVILLLAIVSLIACKKNNPSTPSSPTSPTPTNGMTATETALVGIWYWDKTEDYSGGILQSSSSSIDICINDSTNTYQQRGYYTDLRATKYNNMVITPQSYDLIQYWHWFGPPTASAWWVYPVSVNYSKPFLFASMAYGFTGLGVGFTAPTMLTHQMYIGSLTSNQLILESWGGSIPQGEKIFFHK